MKPTFVVIVGGGFAGINAAKKLRKAKGLDGNPVQITIIDRRNHHLFQPLLYQVATAGLSPADIAMPIRALFKEPNVEVVLDEVTGVDAERRVVQGKSGVYAYDYLILACGANHSYFGRDEWEEFAPGLKSIEQATEIRRRILSAFEEAEKAPRESQAPWLTFAIVGGGPTGVELAGAIAELARHTVEGEYRHFDPARSRVMLIEAGPRVLAHFDPELSARAFEDLGELGVEVHVNSRVEKVDAEGITLGGKLIRAKTVIWAAGVAPSVLGKALKAAELDKSGRVIVEPDLRLKSSPRIFVLGDQANCRDLSTGQPLPGLAPVAMQQGRWAARNIERLIAGVPTEPFRYHDKGSMATVGRSRAVMQTGSLKLGGMIAWLGWLVIHIYYLIGFKNRILVLLQWLWSYATFSRGARLIADKDWHLKK